MRHVLDARKLRLTAPLLIGAVLILTPGAGAQHIDEFYSGRVEIKADRSIVSFPDTVFGLVFDTSSCEGCKDTVPIWKKVSNLVLDALITANGTFRIESPEQLDGTFAISDALAEALSDINALSLQKSFPKFTLHDTTIWDPVRMKWHHLPDLSRYHQIQFPSFQTIDSVLERLKSILGVRTADAIPIPTPDDAICSLWVTNEPIVGWHMWERDSVSLKGGANITCAWGILAEKPKGQVYIAVLDDGYAYHEDLDANIAWADDTKNTDAHGNECLGIIAANSYNQLGIAGVAPDAKLKAYNLYDDTAGENSWYDAIFEDTIAVISYSFSSQSPLPSLFDLLCWARDSSHIPVVVSSGSQPGPVNRYPAAWDSLVITVGAHAHSGNVINASNYACDTCDQWLDIVAPGYVLRTTDRFGGYRDFSGTSAATPVVAGIVAMVRNVHPSFTPEIIEEMLQQTADPGIELDSLTRDPRALGYGRVDTKELMHTVVNTALYELARSISTVDDSIPYLIITADSLSDAFQPLADRKTSRGTHAVIETLSDIEYNYSGSDTQEKIRACIKHYSDNRYLEWALLGGDETVVPARYVYNNLYGPGVRFISDYYYACLEGDWNHDNDTLWGEIEDSVDIFPEVAVGRLPITNSAQVANYIAKLAVYEDSPGSAWRTKAAVIGSEMFTGGDGKRMSQSLLGLFPQNFALTELYDTPGDTSSRSTYFNTMNAGQGILLKYGMAHNHGGNFFLRRSDTWDLLHWDDVDTLSNDSMPALVYGATCFNHQIDSNCMAEHYIQHPTGGAIAYIGTSHVDYVYASQNLAVDFFNNLFGSGPKEVGRLLNDSKQTILDKSYWDGAYRHLTYGYMLSGDPSLQIWTDTGAVLSDSTATTLDIIDSVVTVKITSLGSPIEGAVVCIWKQEDFYDDSYSVGLTDANGLVTFANLSFRSGGFATVVATKHNYIAAQDTIFMTCECRNRTGNVNYDKNDNCDLSDLIYLNNYLFSGGPEPPCMDEADVNGDSDVDLSDAIYLVNYLYYGGPDPVICP